MLEIGQVSASYGRHAALRGVDMNLGTGEIVVMLGANGAGKSTLLKCVARLMPALPGSRIRLDGVDLLSLPAHAVVEAGIALVPEGRGIFGELTVRENLQLGAHARRARSSEKAQLERVLSIFPGLSQRMGQTVQTMSGGEQQMVAIGRALMSRPRVLLLDEPSLGLSPIMTGELFRTLVQVRTMGVSVLLVEQNAFRSLRIADRGYLIENGRLVGQGTAQALAADPIVQRAYLGGTSSNLPTPRRSVRAEPPHAPASRQGAKSGCGCGCSS